MKKRQKPRFGDDGIKTWYLHLKSNISGRNDGKKLVRVSFTAEFHEKEKSSPLVLTNLLWFLSYGRQQGWVTVLEGGQRGSCPDLDAGVGVYRRATFQRLS